MGGRLLQVHVRLQLQLSRLLEGAKQQRQRRARAGAAIIINNNDDSLPATTAAALRGGHVCLHVPVPVHGFIYTSAHSYNGGLSAGAAATAMGRSAPATGDGNSIITTISNNNRSRGCLRRGQSRGTRGPGIHIHPDSWMRTPTPTHTLQEFDMHEYLRGLVAVYRKCAAGFSSGQPRARERDGEAGGREALGRQRVSTSQQQRQHQSSVPSLSARAREGGVAHHRRSYSTSATHFSSATAPSSSTSASSSSSSPPSPSGQPGSTNLDFDRLATLIPDQSATGEKSLWYIVATAALLAFHKEAAVGELWAYLSGRCEREGAVGGVDAATRQLGIARRIRESCLKASVLVGFPRGINALLSLHSSLNTHTPPAILTTLTSDAPLRSLTTFASAEERYARGKGFFTQIYAKHTERVLSSMGASSAGDLSYFAVASVYGELMGELRILDGRETVVLEFVCCFADGVGAQAKGHFFGCRNLGVTGPEMRGAIELVRAMAGQLGLGAFLEEVSGEREGFRFLKRAGEW
ncbi:hypothetical protein GX51_08120 [Blastomyces parvus]|uniref:Uncharacterized protein n=1 Tax=Blastomyces parvus TaxID=2060905 RepID=A0A2B7WGU5_9EURO|nr:hypothetical protein GX51_08120 [Blastomyces parvus]